MAVRFPGWAQGWALGVVSPCEESAVGPLHQPHRHADSMADRADVASPPAGR